MIFWTLNYLGTPIFLLTTYYIQTECIIIELLIGLMISFLSKLINIMKIRNYIYTYICMMVIGIYIWSLYDHYFSHKLEQIQIFLELIKSSTASTAWVKKLEYSLWRNLATKVQQGSKAQVFWYLISLHGLASRQGSHRTCSVYPPSRKSTWSGHCSLSL